MDFNKNPLEALGLVTVGAVAGSLATSWRSYLTFKMNLLAWSYDRLGLFPNPAFITSEEESASQLKVRRLRWKAADLLPLFEGPSVQKVLDVQIPSRESGRT